MQELNWLINVVFTLIMGGLFVWDYRTFGEPNHKDFKAIIMSTGVLGTFVGIFVGLMSFDTLALQDSVPLLLDGLKTAFYTSILGMGLAIALSIIQRAKGLKSAQDMNIDYILTQASHLSSLKEIASINAKLLERLNLLPSKEDMLQSSMGTNVLLESSLKKIDLSLQEAIKQLASGASKELIAALELVIRDFNNNLQDQFGENFKELNNAVGKLLEWQNNYKESIEKTQNLLLKAQASLQDSAEAMSSTQKTLDSITQQNTSAMEFYAKSLALIEENKAQGEILRAKLSEVGSLGENARVCLNDMDRFFTKANEGFESLQERADEGIESLKKDVGEYLRELDTHASENMLTLRRFLELSQKEAQDSLTQVIDSHSAIFRSQCEHLSKESEGLFKGLVAAANTQLVELSKELEKNILQNRESSTHNAAEFARLREHIASNHSAILESLESSLVRLGSHNESIMQDMAKGLKGMQDMYLSTMSASVDSLMGKEQELIKMRLDGLNELAQKTDHNLNEQYEKLNSFLKKIASEYLKIMQKLTKDSVAIPKDMGVQVVEDFGQLQHNLLSHLGNLNAQIQHNSMQLIELYRNVQNILNENIEGNKSLQQEIKGTFVSLDESMSASMENFKENYEWFLRRVREMIGARQ